MSYCQIYVWFDALVNYLTAVGYPDLPLKAWPPDYVVVGKDILKFHALYWPAFLMAAELPLPKKILCHGHWLINDAKISKSTGNVIDPLTLAKQFGMEPLRYFLLATDVSKKDGRFDERRAFVRLNSDLANNFGNLASRSMHIKMNPKQVYPIWDPNLLRSYEKVGSFQLHDSLQKLPEQVGTLFDQMRFSEGIDCILSSLYLANAFYQHSQCWTFSESQLEDVHFINFLTYEALRLSGILLQLIIPKTASKMLDRLGIAYEARTFAHSRFGESPKAGSELGPQTGVLFPRVKLPQR